MRFGNLAASVDVRRQSNQFMYCHRLTHVYRLRRRTSVCPRCRHSVFNNANLNLSPLIELHVRAANLIHYSAMARRRTLGPPPLYDEVSVEMRHTKRGSRLVTKKTPVTLNSPAVSSSTSARSVQQAPQQIPNVPEPSGLPDYNEITFEDADIQPPRKGKVSKDIMLCLPGTLSCLIRRPASHNMTFRGSFLEYAMNTSTGMSRWKARR